MKEVKNVLITALVDDKKKLVYYYSDGNKGTRDFKNIAGIKSTATIAGYWKDWYRLGLVEMINVKGGERARKLFNLEDFGIQIPNLIIETDLSPPEQEKKEVDNNDGQNQ